MGVWLLVTAAGAGGNLHDCDSYLRVLGSDQRQRERTRWRRELRRLLLRTSRGGPSFLFCSVSGLWSEARKEHLVLLGPRVRG